MIVKLEEKGLISRDPGVARSIRLAVPHSDLPELNDDEEEASGKAGSAGRGATGSTKIYTLHVSLLGGPLPPEYHGKVINRTFQIRHDQTLEDLHHAIFKAYDCFDEHFYEFQFGKGPHDPNGKRYVLPEMLEQERGDKTIAGDLTQTSIESLSLAVNQPFGYWFDYGDDWWHQIDVDKIDANGPKGQYPKVIRKVSKSPPQYFDEDE